MDVKVGLWRRLSAEELMLLNCGIGKDSWGSLGLQGDQPWDFFGRNDAKAETPVLWPPHAKSWLIGKDSDAGRDWGQEEKRMTEDDRGWDDWMTSLTRWTWVWVNSGSWWWTGGPSVLQFMGSQRVRHDWVTELNWKVRCTLMFSANQWGRYNFCSCVTNENTEGQKCNLSKDIQLISDRAQIPTKPKEHSWLLSKMNRPKWNHLC